MSAVKKEYSTDAMPVQLSLTTLQDEKQQQVAAHALEESMFLSTLSQIDLGQLQWWACKYN